MFFTDSPHRTIWAFDYDVETGNLDTGSRRAWWVLGEGTDGREEGMGAGGEVPDGLCVDEKGDFCFDIWGG